MIAIKHHASRSVRIGLALCGLSILLSTAQAEGAVDAKEVSIETRASTAKNDKTAEAIDAATARAPITEFSKSTNHSVSIRGKVYRYQATPGTITIRNDDGKPGC
jgi:carboxypeptidase C (cathepsin A)